MFQIRLMVTFLLPFSFLDNRHMFQFISEILTFVFFFFLNLTVPPEQLYATQLSQLQEMGFFDTQENIRALRATAGNVHAAVERLLGNPGQ